MPMNALGNFVRERRQDLNLSQQQLAERVGGNYGQSDVSRIERGQIELPRLATMVSLAAALEISIADLLIASGWFDHKHFAAVSPPDAAPDGLPLTDVLSEIDTELEAIRELERQATCRSQQLHRMIRELKATADVSVSLMRAD